MFTHLHLHTQYSLLDGAAKIEEALDRAKELGMTSLAITDHGVMYGVVDFYLAAKKKGIKPIIGCEIYMAKRSRFDKEHISDSKYGHLILLAKNMTGYKNLMKICSYAYIDGYYYKPRADFELLKKYNEGLVCLSGCLKGDVNFALKNNDYKSAKEYATAYKEIFGEDFYLEIQNHSLEDEIGIIPDVIKLSQELNIPLVATNDVHYVKKEDAFLQDVLMCIQTGKKVSDTDRMKMTTDEFYLKSHDEMSELFKDIPEAVSNTSVIADKCNVELDFDTIHLPKYEDNTAKSSDDKLMELCKENLYIKYPDCSVDIKKRLKYELDTIFSMGFSDYFLIVWDYVKYARENGIMVGPGRGSAAGSIVSYLIGITEIDPMKYDLIFERFLNPERVNMPDIDVDFCYIRRQEVIDYVCRKYGKNNVSQIVAFDTMAARGAIRDVGRVLDINYSLCDTVAKCIPKVLNITIKEALETSEELKKQYDMSSEVKTLVDTAMMIEGMPRNITTHAAGVVISDSDISDYVPVLSSDGVILTQYPMNIIEKVGLVKMDFLGLRYLSVIEDCIDFIEEYQGEKLDISNINYHDEDVYRMIASGDTDGVFQLESDGMKNLLRDMKPSCFDDIIAGLSLFRPGTARTQIPLYLKNKNNPDIKYKHPLLEPVLKSTYGSIVYQEQAMQICRTLAGYSMARADAVRKAMAKKKADVMKEERNTFVYGKTDDKGDVIIPGCIRNGVEEKLAHDIFSELEEFASYAFNKSHAAAYSKIAYQTAYLKHHYPLMYLAALLKNPQGGNEKNAMYISSYLKGTSRVLKPDINKSFNDFIPESDGIRSGLSMIKNVGNVFGKKLSEERKANGEFKSFEEFCERMWDSLNKKCIESLILCGVFDSIFPNRRALMLGYEEVVDYAAKRGKEKASGQISLFDSMTEDVNNTGVLDAYSKTTDYSLNEKLMYEKELSGMFLTAHPLDEYKDLYKKYRFSSINEVISQRLKENTHLKLMLFVESIVPKISQKGRMIVNMTVSDLSASASAVMFESDYNKYKDDIKPLSCYGADVNVSYDYNDNLQLIIKTMILADKLSAQSKKLYIKLKSKDMLDDIIGITEHFRGDTPVVVYFEDTKSAFMSPKEQNVSVCDTLMDKLWQKTGKDNVILK